MVKKRLGLMLVLAFGIISICACDNVENIVSDAKEQMEEDAMFTTGQTVEENIDDLVDMMDGENTDSSNTEVVETGSDKKHAIGETVSLVTDGAEDTGEKIDVTFTEWGSTYDEMFGSLTYVRYEIQNTGTESVTVGNSMFSVYADDYNVEQLYYKDDAISLTDISAGRKINGTIYMELNPDTVNTIEIECGDVIWVVKGMQKIAESDVEEGGNEEPIDAELSNDLVYPILVQGYTDGEKCPVMVCDESNGTLGEGSAEEFLASCIDDGITKYPAPYIYNGRIIMPTKWDAPETEWEQGLLSYEDFLNYIMWLEETYCENKAIDVMSYASWEELNNYDGKWEDDKGTISVSIYSDFSSANPLEEIGVFSVDDGSMSGYVYCLGKTDYSVHVCCITSDGEAFELIYWFDGDGPMEIEQGIEGSNVETGRCLSCVEKYIH